MKLRNQSGFSGWSFLIVVVLLTGVGGYFYFMNQKKGVQSIDQTASLKIISLELGQLDPEDGLEIKATLKAGRCTTQTIFASIVDLEEDEGVLSFHCMPKKKDLKIDPTSIRKISFLWAPKLKSVKGTESSISDERSLNVYPLVDSNLELEVELNLEAKFTEEKKGLFKPKITYSQPKLNRRVKTDSPIENDSNNETPSNKDEDSKNRMSLPEEV